MRTELQAEKQAIYEKLSNKNLLKLVLNLL